jgi:hypothetical protein
VGTHLLGGNERYDRECGRTSGSGDIQKIRLPARETFTALTGQVIERKVSHPCSVLRYRDDEHEGSRRRNCLPMLQVLPSIVCGILHDRIYLKPGPDWLRQMSSFVRCQVLPDQKRLGRCGTDHARRKCEPAQLPGRRPNMSAGNNCSLQADLQELKGGKAGCSDSHVNF